VTANPSRWATDFAEYLRFERDAAQRHELIDGEIVAMAGAPRRHNLLCGRLHDAVRPQLGDGPCVLERSDQRLAVNAAGKGWVGYYPDLAVYCTDEVHQLDPETRLSPTLLIEVTSKSTEKKDRGVKLDPPVDGSFYHRAFFPDDDWRVRTDRLGEPWELFLARVDGKLTVKLERVVDNPDSSAEQKQLLQSYPVESPEQLLKLVNDNQSQWTKAIFVYPPADLTYGEALTWTKPALATYPRVFFFTPVAPATQPATQP